MSRDEKRTSGSNPFTEPAQVEGYEAWYETTGRRADHLEKALLGRLLGDFPHAQTLVEMGCGTGHYTRWLAGQGLEVVGVDPSTPMLKEATRSSEISYIQGNALGPPFADNVFDLVAFITTVEFLPDPLQGLSEAFRVTRQGLILGVLNRRSFLGMQLQDAKEPPWDAAQFLSPQELVQLVQQAAGSRPTKIKWRTTLYPILPLSLPLPGGGFIGMSVRLG